MVFSFNSGLKFSIFIIIQNETYFYNIYIFLTRMNIQWIHTINIEMLFLTNF